MRSRYAVGMNLTDGELSRFNSNVDKTGDCWLWTAPLDRDGYGSFFFRRRNRRAHRVAWFAAHGAIPDGMVINHTCRQRNCVNPQHLNMVTASENSLRDSTSKGYINSQKTHCPRGHAYDRTYRLKSGRTNRGCSTCEREKARRLRAKWRADDDVAC